MSNGHWRCTGLKGLFAFRVFVPCSEFDVFGFVVTSQDTNRQHPRFYIRCMYTTYLYMYFLCITE